MLALVLQKIKFFFAFLILEGFPLSTAFFDHLYFVAQLGHLRLKALRLLIKGRNSFFELGPTLLCLQLLSYAKGNTALVLFAKASLAIELTTENSLAHKPGFDTHRWSSGVHHARAREVGRAQVHLE